MTIPDRDRDPKDKIKNGGVVVRTKEPIYIYSRSRDRTLKFQRCIISEPQGPFLNFPSCPGHEANPGPHPITLFLVCSTWKRMMATTLIR